MKFDKFSNQKNSFLSKPDKSGIGGIDEAIRPLINIINKSQDYYTTSSCAGRIILMIETGKKLENVFVFSSHFKIRKSQIENALRLDKRARSSLIYMKAEPCILHVACRTIGHAERLVNIARQSGWKKSGIIGIKPERVMAELVSTEILATPVHEHGKLLFDESYLNILVHEANQKLAKTREKIKKLQNSFK